MVERVTGLSLSDSLNLALFLLTIASLIVAAAGVWFAKVTLDEARISGEAQSEALEHQIHALDTAVDSIRRQTDVLNKSQGTLEKLHDQMTSGQSISEKQEKVQESLQSLQGKQVQTAKEQLKVITQLSELQNRHPVAEITFRCDSGIEEVCSKRLQQNPTEHAYIGRWKKTACLASVDNVGNESIIAPSFTWSSSWVDSERQFRSLKLSAPGARNANMGLDLSDGGKIYPHSISKTRANYAFKIEIPDEVDDFGLIYSLVGENLAQISGVIRIKVHRTDLPDIPEAEFLEQRKEDLKVCDLEEYAKEYPN